MYCFIGQCITLSNYMWTFPLYKFNGHFTTKETCDLQEISCKTCVLYKSQVVLRKFPTWGSQNAS